MISKLIENNGIYYCSNCHMKQSKLSSSCWWCEYIFSNYEEVIIKELKENESNIYRRD